MAKKTKKSQNENVVLSQKSIIFIALALFTYSVYLSVKLAYEIFSAGNNYGLSPLFTMVFINLFLPIAIFSIIYSYILKKNKKLPLTTLVFHSLVYTVLVFVVEAFADRYFSQMFKNRAFNDWQYFCILIAEFVFCTTLVLGFISLMMSRTRLGVKK